VLQTTGSEKLNVIEVSPHVSDVEDTMEGAVLSVKEAVDAEKSIENPKPEVELLFIYNAYTSPALTPIQGSFPVPPAPLAPVGSPGLAAGSPLQLTGVRLGISEQVADVIL